MVHAPTNPSAFLWPLRQNLGNHCQLATVNNRSVSSRSYSPCDRTVSSLPSSPSNSQATPRSCIALATEQKRRLSTVHDIQVIAQPPLWLSQQSRQQMSVTCGLQPLIPTGLFVVLATERHQCLSSVHSKNIHAMIPVVFATECHKHFSANCHPLPVRSTMFIVVIAQNVTISHLLAILQHRRATARFLWHWQQKITDSCV